MKSPELQTRELMKSWNAMNLFPKMKFYCGKNKGPVFGKLTGPCQPLKSGICGGTTGQRVICAKIKRWSRIQLTGTVGD
jgi:hypothetical protein